MKNRRSLERYNLNLLSFVKSEKLEPASERPKYMIASNICSGGVFLKTDKPMPLNTRVHVDFFLIIKNQVLESKKKMSLVEITGRVIRLQDDGMAVKFDRNYRIWPFSENQDS